MSTALVETNNRPPGTDSLPAWLERSVSAMSTSGYPRLIPASKALTQDQRQAATAISTQISALLTPAAGDGPRVATSISLLLSMYPIEKGEIGEDARSATWALAMEGLPAWAVEQAVRDWIQRKIPDVNYDFAPKPPVFRGLVEARLSKLHQRRSTIALLLKAIPEPEISKEDAELDRVGIMARRLKDELRRTIATADLASAAGATSPFSPAEVAEAERRLAEMRVDAAQPAPAATALEAA